jgi:hypothetical protein
MSPFRVPRLVAVVEVGDTKLTSHVCSMTRNPHWMQHGVLPLQDGDSETGVVKVSVWDKRAGGEGKKKLTKCMGAALVALSKLDVFKPTKLELSLQGGKRVGGAVTVVLEVRDAQRTGRREQKRVARANARLGRWKSQKTPKEPFSQSQGLACAGFFFAEKQPPGEREKEHNTHFKEPTSLGTPQLFKVGQKQNQNQEETLPETRDATAPGGEAFEKETMTKSPKKTPADVAGDETRGAKKQQEDSPRSTYGDDLYLTRHLVFSASPPPPPPSPTRAPRAVAPAIEKSRTTAKKVGPGTKTKKLIAPLEVSFFGMTTPPPVTPVMRKRSPHVSSPSASVSPSTPSPGAERKTQTEYSATCGTARSPEENESPRNVSVAEAQTQTEKTETVNPTCVETEPPVIHKPAVVLVDAGTGTDVPELVPEVREARTDNARPFLDPLAATSLVSKTLPPIRVVSKKCQETSESESASTNEAPGSPPGRADTPVPPDVTAPVPSTEPNSSPFASRGGSRAVSAATGNFSPKRPPLPHRIICKSVLHSVSNHTRAVKSVAPKRSARTRGANAGANAVVPSPPLDESELAAATLRAVVRVELDEVRRLGKTALGSLAI